MTWLMKKIHTAGAAATIALILILFGNGVNGQDECKGLLPECTHDSVYKCGDAKPVCGGDNIQRQRDSCSSVLLVCTPTGSSLVFNEASKNGTNTTDGDSEAGGDWDWVGFDTFDDVCSKIRLELPTCDGPSYKCGSEAVCGELKEWMTCSGNLVVCDDQLSVVSSTTTSTTVTVTTEESGSSTTTNNGSSTTTTTSTTTTSSAPGMTASARGILIEVTLLVGAGLIFMA